MTEWQIFGYAQHIPHLRDAESRAIAHYLSRDLVTLLAPILGLKKAGAL